jgi:hypothetical protein
MNRDRCWEPLDFPPGLTGDACRAGYAYMLQRLGETLMTEGGRARIEEDHEIAMEMRDKYPIIPVELAAGIKFKAVNDMAEIQKL